MRVLLVDDHEIVWSGTCRLLARLAHELKFPGTFFFHAVASVEQAQMLDEPPFDILLLDYHLPGISGIDALAAMRQRFEGTPVCVVSGDTDPLRIRGIIEAGASGFIPKSYGLEQMDAALRVVLRHRVYLPAEFALVEESARQHQLDELPSSELVQFVATELSARQREVLALAVQGLPIKLISRRLGIAEGTVKVHLSMVYRAMGVRNRTDALCRIFKAQAATAFGLL